MKRILFCIALTFLALFSCTRDEMPPEISYEFSEVKSFPDFTSCTVTCRNESVNGEGIKARLLLSESEDLSDASRFPMQVSGDTLLCNLTGLQRGILYYYGFEMYTNTESYHVKGIYKFKTREGDEVTVTTFEITNITQTSADGGGNVTVNGEVSIQERGICWSLHHNPNHVQDSHATNGTGSGWFTVALTDLLPDTTYYVKAYAIHNNVLTLGNEVSFKTLGSDQPIVITGQVTNITSTSATGHGTIVSEGTSPVTERGICWSTDHNPTIWNNHTSNGDGLGSYSCAITGLTSNQTYYVRAYAVTEHGVTFGEEVSFTALEGLPEVATLEITDITTHSAKGKCKVTGQGGSTVTERGICWSNSHNPTTNGSHAASGTGTGDYSVEMTGLQANSTYFARAYATNSAGTVYGEELSFTTLQEVSLPTVSTAEVTNIGKTTALGGGDVTDDGGADITERGICWSTSHNPTISGSHASNGTGTGSYTVNMTGLTQNTTYYVRAYAKNSQGVGYGDEVSFTTAQDVMAPTVTTSQVTNITQTTATGGGNVTSTGGAAVTERGICWSTSHNPTTNNSHANSGTGTGSYSINMTGLTAGTTYYVRAYAINSQGTSYGNEVSFITTANLPTVTTRQVTNITQTTATGGGNVTATGGADITERGICWSTSHNPTTSSSHASSGTGTGSYTVNMTGLTANTTYYVRAYAINSAGTAYGNEESFTTLQNVTLPTVTTSQVSNITQTSATGGGNVTATGGAEVTERGICWSTSHNPTTSSSHANNGTGTGSYTVNMTGLTANTTYYVRAYAINSAGTAYGSEVNFTTSQIPSYTISVSANPSTGGSVTGGGTYQQGQSCTVSAIATTGYTFVRWTENGSQVSTNANYTFTVNGNRILVAQFQTQSYTITASANPTNGGSVSGGGNYNYGQSCTVHATANSGYTFTNWTENGSQVSTNANYTFTVTSNRDLVANFTYNGGGNAPTGAINGLFTINANGDQVYFSQGNLQYQASTNTWRFAENQWDYVGSTCPQNGQPNGTVNGSSNHLISPNYSGWIDLFDWGTSGYNHGAVCYQPWSTSNTGSDFFAYGNEYYNLYDETGLADWGYNIISNGGGQTNQWRTLTTEEWDYVINARSTLSNIRYAIAQVNNVNGIILLPDDWNTSFYSLYSTNVYNALYNSNIISVSQWQVLEANGAVFLPAAGWRGSLGIYCQVPGDEGYYWSSSYATYSIPRAHTISFNNKNTGCYGLHTNGMDNRYCGNSVRLVQDY